MNALRRDHRIIGPDSPEERRAEIQRLSRKLWNAATRVRIRAAEELVEFGSDAVGPLCGALHLPQTEVQVAVAEALGKLRAVEAVEPLLENLRSPNPLMQIAAATALGRIGDARAQDGLLELLEVRDLSVKAAAATALGELGRDESIPALMNAYRECFVGRSARGQRYLGPAILVVVVVLFSLLLWGSMMARMGGLMALSNTIFQLSVHYFGARRTRSKVACAVTEALVKIAEHNPRPELHGLVRELRATAQDRLQQEKATRKASLVAAERIDTLTSALHALPVPSGVGAPDLASLPQPAEAPEAVLSRKGR